MPLVSLEQDAHYVRVDDRYVEICTKCMRPRTADADTCECGAKFERLKRSFFALSWDPTTLTPRIPDICPHCAAKPTHLRSITLKLPTQSKGGGSATWTTRTIEIPSCKKMLPPFLAYLLFLTSIFFTVVFGLATIFGGPLATIILFALCLFACSAAWRAYGWIRFARFDHRSLRFRVRRLDYARELADRNHGRVL